MHNLISHNLRHLMDTAGVGENELARQTGIQQPTIHRIVVGTSRDPRRSTLQPLAEFFGVTVEQLINDDLGHWQPGYKPSHAEKEMVELLQQMNEEQKQAIVDLIKTTLKTLKA